jgi:hypothetical protein
MVFTGTPPGRHFIIVYYSSRKKGSGKQPANGGCSKGDSATAGEICLSRVFKDLRTVSTLFVDTVLFLQGRG